MGEIVKRILFIAKETIKGIPYLGRLARKIKKRIFDKLHPFPGSEEYWIRRYDTGGNSGSGSYNRLAEFKGEMLNRFVKNHGILTVIEYGCGDGNQLKLAEYPAYIGFDISPKAVSRCREIFQHDKTKSFRLMSEYRQETAQLTISLDVLYHLVEDETYHSYMKRLFDSADQYVAIYSSNTDMNSAEHDVHVRHRKFTAWVEVHRPQWRLIQHIPNKFPFKGDYSDGSFADFFIYEISL